MRIEALIMFLSLVVAPLAHMSGNTPSKAGLVLMVVPFWEDPERVAAEAGVQVVGPTRAPLGTLVSVEAVAQFSDLSRAGAWFLIDPETSKWICGT